VSESENENETDGKTGTDTRAKMRAIGAGMIQTFGVLLAFLGFGLGWAHLESLHLAARPSVSIYPGGMPEQSDPTDTTPEAVRPDIWLVDGFNVLHASLLGGRDREEWWSQSRREEVMALARTLDGSGDEVWVVFDGARPSPAEDSSSSAVKQVFAPSADEWLLQRVRETQSSGPVAVVTGDRRLAARARHRGALIVSPGEFVARCRAERPEQEPS
jgi:predicted RNA-binding protein with PIN domain